MKRLLSFVVIAIAASTVVFAGRPINSSELPEAAQAFLKKHFPNEQVRKAEQDQGHRGTEYEVDLTGGAEIDFLSDGNWKEVKAARGKAVPNAIVPSAIVKYVAKNFEGLSITEIARKRGGFEVELSNGTELKLTEDAKPMPARDEHGYQHH